MITHQHAEDLEKFRVELNAKADDIKEDRARKLLIYPHFVEMLYRTRNTAREITRSLSRIHDEMAEGRNIDREEILALDDLRSDYSTK
jgi:hypothetical protein